MEVMGVTHRVIECALGCASLLNNVATSDIAPDGPRRDCIVTRRGDASRAGALPGTPILFFSQAAWGAATEGLTNDEIDEVVQDRRRRLVAEGAGAGSGMDSAAERMLSTLTAKAMQRVFRR